MNETATATEETVAPATSVLALPQHSPAMERLWRALQSVIVWAAFIAATIACSLALYGWRPDLTLLGLSLATLMMYPSVAIHEAGHYLGARLAGMTVMHVRVGHLELIGRRSGFKARWHKPKTKSNGSVIAFPRIDRPFREQMLLFVRAGPMANLIAGAGLAGLAWWWRDVFFGTALFSSAAAINLALGIANLCPTHRTKSSDGMKWRQWRQGVPDDHPQMLIMRMVSSSIAGQTAAQQPPELADAFSRGEPPLQLMAQWIHLKAHQERGEWRQAADRKPGIDALFAKLEAKVTENLADFRWSMDLELAFSRAMADRAADELKGIPFHKDAAWSTPWTWPRCQALLAALDRDAARRDLLLHESERLANDSLDLAWSRSEADLRAAIRSIEASAR